MDFSYTIIPSWKWFEFELSLIEWTREYRISDNTYSALLLVQCGANRNDSLWITARVLYCSCALSKRSGLEKH